MTLKNGLFLFIILFTSCSPYIDKVRYYEYSNKYPTRFEIIINEKDKFFEGRESFLSFRREYYTFYSPNRTDFNENDLFMIIYNNEKSKYDTIFLNKASISLTKIDSLNRKIEVNIDDSLISKMVNGTFYLKLVDSDNEYKMFELEN